MEESSSDGEVPLEDDIEDEGGWSSCEEVEEEEATCLFCSSVLTSKQNAAQSVFLHCKQSHDVDLIQLLPAVLTDEFSYIKLVNYLRKHKPTVTDFLSFIKSPGAVGKLDDIYMQPVDPTDSLLFHDVAEFFPESCATSEVHSLPSDVHSAGDRRKGSDDGAGHGLLEQRATAAEGLAARLQDTVARLQSDVEIMRTAAQNLVMSSGGSTAPVGCSVASLRPDEDDAYFSSYGHFSIHQEMLQDRPRTESYRDAILANSHLFRGKTVLDVGCGTGILSMFAAQAGASAVYGVDMSDIIYTAMDIVRENKLDNIITLIHGRIEDISLPVKQVDIIVSEWMGYCLLFESMLDSVLFARDRWLAPDGIVMPNRCTIHIAGVDDSDLYSRNVGYWSDVYGFRMSSMRTLLLKEAAVTVVPSGSLCTPAVLLQEINCQSCRLTDLNFAAEFTLRPKGPSTIHALVCYFDAHFDRGDYSAKIVLSTSPSQQATHWKQTLLVLPVPISTRQDDVLVGKFTCQKNVKDPRSLVIQVIIGGSTHKYLLS